MWSDILGYGLGIIISALLAFIVIGFGIEGSKSKWYK